MNRADLSTADIEALVALRLASRIRIDEAGKHAESLHRLARADVVRYEDFFCTVTVDQVTEGQRALGFRPGGGRGPQGQHYTVAPHWDWDSVSSAPRLLAEVEGRRGSTVNWNDFLAWFDGHQLAFDCLPTVQQAANHFGVTVFDMVDSIDGFYWALRGATPGVALADQQIDVDGE